MTQQFTTQQQINALEKSIMLERYKYTLALEDGQPNSCLEAIGYKINKLMLILRFLNIVCAKNTASIVWKQIEIVDNNSHNTYPEKVLEQLYEL